VRVKNIKSLIAKLNYDDNARGIELTSTNEYLSEDRFYDKDCVKIVFRPLIIFDHKRIVDLFLNPMFGKSVSGTVSLRDFTVTTGGYEVSGGFQYTAFGFFNPQAGKRAQHNGTEYPVKLAEDEYISKMRFAHVINNRTFMVTISSNCLEISPRPSTRVVSTYIRKLKESLTRSPIVFRKSAEVKLKSAILDFLGGRYRSVPHSIYYALHDLVKSLSIWSGMDSNIKHDKKAQERLTIILNQIVSGDHKTFKRSDVWKEHKDLFFLIDPKRYSSLITELYEMRRMADYEKSYEITEFVPELSGLLLKVEELLTLVGYVEEGSVVVANDKLVQIFQQQRELEPSPYSIFGWIDSRKNEPEIVQKGLILAEDFDLKKFLTRFLRRKQIHYSPFCPPTTRDLVYVKCEKKDGKWTFSQTFDKEIAKERGYIPYTIETVRNISQLTKTDEIAFLEKSDVIKARRITFSEGEYFFELYILFDGRFYIVSPLADQNANKQVSAIMKLRDMIARDVLLLYEDCSTISFSAISIVAHQ